MEQFCAACREDREIEVIEREETYAVRDAEVSVSVRVGICKECGSEVAVDEFDDETLHKAFAEYRRLSGLMTPEEMKELRSRYGLGVRPFSLLLGWGELTLFRYETGSVQDAAHESQLRLAEYPENIQKLAQLNGHKLTPRQLSTLDQHIASAMGDLDEAHVLEDRFAPREVIDEFGGFVPLHLGKLREMMMFFCQLKGVSPTKLNKLLFYADFLHFKNYGVSISGSPYLAFQRGPVPQHYEWIKADLIESGAIEAEDVDWGGGIVGELLTPTRPTDESMFATEEFETLAEISARLGAMTARQLMEQSHAEKAYSETAPKNPIAYGWSLELSV